VFKRFGTREYPPTGLNTGLWMKLPLTNVPIEELVTTQEHIYIRDILGKVLKPSVSGDEFPHVVSWNGTFYLEDGHHRAVRAIIEGKNYLQARVFKIEEN